MASQTGFIDTSSEVIKQLSKFSKEALRDGAKIAAKAIKDAAPDRSGRLKEAAGYRVTTKNHQPYAQVGFFATRMRKRKKFRMYFANPSWFESGVKPHTIKPKNKTATGPKAVASNQVLYGKLVHHPGLSPRPFMAQAVRGKVAEIRKAQEKGLSKLNKKLEELRSIPDTFDVEDGEKV